MWNLHWLPKGVWYFINFLLWNKSYSHLLVFPYLSNRKQFVMINGFDTEMESLKYNLFNIKFTTIIKKSFHQVCGSCFLHIFIHITPAIDIFSISSFFEHSTTSQSHAFHSSQFTSCGIPFSHLGNMTRMKNILKCVCIANMYTVLVQQPWNLSLFLSIFLVVKEYAAASE